MSGAANSKPAQDGAYPMVKSWVVIAVAMPAGLALLLIVRYIVRLLCAMAEPALDEAELQIEPAGGIKN